MPLRTHGSLSLNWALMAAGLVDRLQMTIFPVITGKTGTDPDGNTQQLVYRPTLHVNQH